MLFVEGRIEEIDVLLVHFAFCKLQALAEVINLSKCLYPLRGKWYRDFCF